MLIKHFAAAAVAATTNCNRLLIIGFCLLLNDCALSHANGLETPIQTCSTVQLHHCIMAASSPDCKAATLACRVSCISDEHDSDCLLSLADAYLLGHSSQSGRQPILQTVCLIFCKQLSFDNVACLAFRCSAHIRATTVASVEIDIC
ncbi:conserved hypothetical protein [Trichinella spiralis]|uniref:hypothetical protein n=1 Tax=Trichinella spiralis TaxID=6334 RepID=UPI0001EFBBE9|nr:conserved hypothetical protein [Trichinella spiralis]